MLAFGLYYLGDWKEAFSNADEIILHTDYLNHRETKSFDADIAIVITKEFIVYNLAIKPICLWPTEVDSTNTNSIIDLDGTFVGWGKMHKSLRKNTARKIMLPVVRNQFCFPNENR